MPRSSCKKPWLPLWKTLVMFPPNPITTITYIKQARVAQLVARQLTIPDNYVYPPPPPVEN